MTLRDDGKSIRTTGQSLAIASTTVCNILTLPVLLPQDVTLEACTDVGNNGNTGEASHSRTPHAIRYHSGLETGFFKFILYMEVGSG